MRNLELIYDNIARLILRALLTTRGNTMDITANRITEWLGTTYTLLLTKPETGGAFALVDSVTGYERRFFFFEGLDASLRHSRDYLKPSNRQ